MRPSDIKKAEIEAKRFLERIEELRSGNQLPKIIVEANWHLTGSKETGALRRASLDLTRALSSMRKG